MRKPPPNNSLSEGRDTERHTVTDHSNFTIALIKAPSVGRRHDLPIISWMTQSGFVINALERRSLCPTTIKAFYQAHVGKPYFQSLAQSVSGDIVSLMISRRDNKDAISEWRTLMGATDASTALPGTIRHRFGGFNWRGKDCPLSDNAVHGSDSIKAAAYEYSLLFNRPNWPTNPHELLG